MIRITEDEYRDMDESGGGFCLSCEEPAYGVEPDAREYTCESCGERKVFGVSELLIMGEIEFKGDDDEDESEEVPGTE